MMELLASELIEAFHSRNNAVESTSTTAAEQWARHIHVAFYSSRSTRGSNKFLGLESTLTQVFTRLSNNAENAPFFWEFAVQVLLVLAREPTTVNQPTASIQAANSSSTTDKKRAKKCQPNAPLAFLMVNALMKTTDTDATREQMELCRRQGRNNEELRAFCMKALGNSSAIEDPKLLVELLGLFQITDIDLVLVRNALGHLLVSKSHAALIKLCETFTSVDWPFDTIVKKMVQTKDWTSAGLLVRTFERDGETTLARVLIDETIIIRDFKRAHRFVSYFNLQKQYPDIDVLYSRDGLMRLIETQRWQLALTFVGHDATLQGVLLEHMVAAGELAHADQLAKKMVAAGSELDISLMIQSQRDSGEIGRNPDSNTDASEAEKFLTLPMEDQRIVFCDSEDDVKEAIEHFFGPRTHSADQMVGLDVEWKPITSRSKSSTAVASILQIASPDRVFIVDLLALHDSELLFDSFLLKLLTSRQWLKLGFSFDSDLKVLHQTFPERQAFATISSFLDLNALGLKSGGLAGTSLSQCVRHLLGKPLDKRMQLSDWEQRPLSQDQLKYAALDAHCLIQVVAKLKSGGASENSLPRWREASKHIGKLDHEISLIEGEIEKLVSLRFEYQKKWFLDCAAENEAHSTALLVTPQDISQLWLDRKKSRAHEPDMNFDTSLRFLPMDQITLLLEDQEYDCGTRDFIVVNSICVFVVDTPHVVCIDASCKLDMAQFARFCDVGRRRVRLATASECRDVFGFAPGTVAPFGHKVSAPNSGEPLQIGIFADSGLRKARYLAAGSGSQDEAIWVESKALFALISIKLVDDISIPRDSSCSSRSSRSSSSPTGADYTDATTGGAVEKEPKILEYKFLADSMVTQVGRWLRTIGVDVVAWNPDDFKVARSKDPKSVMLSYAVKEDRIVLTRDTSLPSRRDAGACFVLSDDECYKQFREVKLQFGLLSQVDTRSSRCARCNSDTFSPIDAASARKKMSERLRKKVPGSVTKFWTCHGCGRIYWEGPKYTPAMGSGAKPSPDGRVIYRPAPRKRVVRDPCDTRHLPDD